MHACNILTETLTRICHEERPKTNHDIHVVLAPRPIRSAPSGHCDEPKGAVAILQEFPLLTANCSTAALPVTVNSECSLGGKGEQPGAEIRQILRVGIIGTIVPPKSSYLLLEKRSD